MPFLSTTVKWVVSSLSCGCATVTMSLPRAMLFVALLGSISGATCLARALDVSFATGRACHGLVLGQVALRDETAAFRHRRRDAVGNPSRIERVRALRLDRMER